MSRSKNSRKGSKKSMTQPTWFAKENNIVPCRRRDEALLQAVKANPDSADNILWPDRVRPQTYYW